MALADILRAITEEANAELARLEHAFQEESQKCIAQHAQDLADIERSVTAQKEQKKHMLQLKAEGHAKMQTRHALLSKKQEVLEGFYNDVLQALLDLDSEKKDAFFALCLASTKASAGVLRFAKDHEKHAAKLAKGDITCGDSINAKGGFILVTDEREYNFTFESLVQELLRPSTEISVASALFSA